MSATPAYDPSNVFAKILRGELPAHKVYEDDKAIAFLDIMPRCPGHTLVIPKAPARNFLDLPESAVGPYLERVQKIARAVRKALNPDGLLVTQFNGSAAGQSVVHVHFHSIPRWADAKLAGHGHGKMADAQELEALAEKISAAL